MSIKVGDILLCVRTYYYLDPAGIVQSIGFSKSTTVDQIFSNGDISIILPGADPVTLPVPLLSFYFVPALPSGVPASIGYGSTGIGTISAQGTYVPPTAEELYASIHGDMFEAESPGNWIAKKCECGCSAVGSLKHSDYCPLYSVDKDNY